MFFRFAPMGKVEKTRFEQSYTTFVNPALCAAWKSPPKMVIWNRNFKIRFPGCFFVSAPWGKSKKRVLNQNYTTFVNPALCAAWKSPPKMVIWNQNFKIRFPGCFFLSPRWGKSKKRVLNKIIRPSSTRLYALLGKAHPKWWYVTEIVKFDSQGVFSFRPYGKVEKTRFEQNYTTFVNPALCAAWKSPPKMVVWNRNFKIRFPGCFFFRPDGESRKNAFWTKLYDLRQPGFMRCLETPPKMVVWNQSCKIRLPRVFFRFAPMGKVEKTRFEQNYTTFVNPALCAAWKSPPKMVVCNRNCKIRFPGCFFVSPRWGKSKKRVLNKIMRPSSTRLYALLGKAHPKWWYETEILKFDSQGVFSFRPYGESRKNAFWTKLYDLRQSGFMRCLEKPTQNGGMKPKF